MDIAKAGAIVMGTTHANFNEDSNDQSIGGEMGDQSCNSNELTSIRRQLGEYLAESRYFNLIYLSMAHGHRPP